MAKWIRQELINCVDLISGGTPKTTISEYWDGNIPWISIKDFNNDRRYVYQTEKHISELGLKNSSTKLLQKDDIIISARGTIGEIAMIPFPMAFNQSCYGIRGKNGINKTFLYYLLKNSITQLKAITHGSVFDTITKDTFTGLIVSLPEKRIQDSIADILSYIDDKIEINEKVNDNLEQQVSAIYKAWFEDFNLSGGICPTSWKQGTLADIATVTSGKRPPMKSAERTDVATVPLVGAASVMGFTSEANHSNKILVTGRVGTHGVVQRFNSPCWTSDNTLVITSNLYEYTYQILKRIDYRSMNRGSTQPLITQSDMNKVPILIPNQEILQDFETLAGQLMAQLESNLVENSKLAELRDTLLPKLMSGEIDISDIQL